MFYFCGQVPFLYVIIVGFVAVEQARLSRSTSRCTTWSTEDHGTPHSAHSRSAVLPHAEQMTLQRWQKNVCTVAHSRHFHTHHLSRAALSHAYMHTCTHTCMHACMHTCKHANMHTCIHAYMHTCIHAYMHTCIHTCIHAYIHAHIHTYIQTDRQTDRQTDIHTYRHTHIHTYIHTYVRTYVHAYYLFTYFHTQSFTTSFVFPSFPVPATTFETQYWKKLTCGVIRSFNWSVFARKMHSTSECAMIVLSKSKSVCVCECLCVCVLCLFRYVI